MFGPAGPVYEKALVKLNEDSSSTTTMKRVITDQAGMSYGISGNIPKARAIFEKAIAADPDYPMYYYNLACADAEEENLAGAKKHLREAFDRKTNVIAGETMPDQRRMILSCLIATTKTFGRSCRALAGSDEAPIASQNDFSPIVYSCYSDPSLRSGFQKKCSS